MTFPTGPSNDEANQVPNIEVEIITKTSELPFNEIAGLYSKIYGSKKSFGEGARNNSTGDTIPIEEFDQLSPEEKAEYTKIYTEETVMQYYSAMANISSNHNIQPVDSASKE